MVFGFLRLSIFWKFGRKYKRRERQEGKGDNKLITSTSHFPKGKKACGNGKWKHYVQATQTLLFYLNQSYQLRSLIYFNLLAAKLGNRLNSKTQGLPIDLISNLTHNKASTMSNASEIKNLISTQGYSQSIIPQLEQYVLSQSTTPVPYDFNANRILVKLYQFFPQSSSTDYTALVALLSILFGSPAQFGAINCLIPEGSAAKSSETFSSIVAMNESRDACLFSNLWNTLESLKGSASSAGCVKEAVQAPHALKALRTSILETLSLTFKDASEEMVLAAVNLGSGDELKGFDVVESVGGGKVVFQDSAENTKRDKGQHAEGALDYGAVRGLVGTMGRVAVE